MSTCNATLDATLDRRTVFPGGCVVDEHWWSPTGVDLVFAGELDAYDEYALVDLLTGLVLEGALDMTIDAGALDFCGLGPLHVLDRARRRLAAASGVFTLCNASARLAGTWTRLVGTPS